MIIKSINIININNDLDNFYTRDSETAYYLGKAIGNAVAGTTGMIGAEGSFVGGVVTAPTVVRAAAFSVTGALCVGVTGKATGHFVENPYIFAKNLGSKGTNKDSYLTSRQLNQYKSQVTSGEDVHFNTEQEALDLIEKKFPDFKQEVAESRSAEGWHFDSHPIGGSETAIDHINIYSKSQGFRVHITWGN